ncbi:Vmh family MBL fold metallo-hydrolase [Vibrio sp. Of7-15]|uniref:Vmh family MBL fold metallo-hydrolase n=1 Tax=Vibrio sp. Of7-15 TaxID=2724879 RepID=UPI001EF3784E|nr:Vmh family MBL fold metallo-hydrolase [Vibrio sp. Of7-15]MCG7499609.1 Vmh family MBL fold metallo-hydrolase [Vibrio sp. Of7-15]
MKFFVKAALVTALFTAGHVVASDLNITQYNPGSNGIFPTTSVLISGEKEAILFDAQFSTVDGKALVEKIKATGKTLNMIYVSSGDPDYYFGLEPLVNAFPEAKVVASQSIVDHITKTKEGKLAYWGPILKDGAPNSIVVPQVFNDTELYLEGKKIEVKEINSHQAYLWLPSQKTVFGGVSVTSGMHVWTADSQTKQARSEWVQSLERMKALEPQTVIPGHYLGEVPSGAEAVQFTIDYLTNFETALKSSKNVTSGDVIKAMKQRYPKLEGVSDLELSAKVNTGEMEW